MTISEYQIAVPKQYRMLIDAVAIIIPLMKKKVDILNPSCLSASVSISILIIGFNRFL